MILTISIALAIVILSIVLIYFTGIQWIYLCRVSILSGLFLGLLPILALLEGGRRLLLGAFDISSGWPSATFGFCLFLALWAIGTSINVVLEAGSLRVRQQIVRNVKIVRRLVVLTLGIIAVLNWTIICFASVGRGFGAILSFWAGLSFGALIYFLEKRFPSRRRPANAGKTRVGLRAARVNLFGKQYELPVWLTRGYLTPVGTGLQLSKVHVKALWAAVAILLFYLGIFFVSMVYKLPGPAYIALVVTVLDLVFGALAFFFDAYRIPVIVPLVIWISLFSGNPKVDHYFRVTPDSEPETSGSDPATILANAQSDGRPIVLVAAAGGGIQAAAWTMQVLAGLQREVDTIQPGIFAKSVRLMSGVSGGSTGVMYFVHSAYPTVDPEMEQKRLEAAVRAAESSSLESAVRGLAYADLFRLLAPFFVWNRFSDRAEELEDAWVQNGDATFRVLGVPSLSQATLKGWRRDLCKGQRPAVIFNASVVETGQRFSFSTSHLDPQKKQIAQGQDDFDVEHPSRNVPIVTVARLSATFPFVSPAARCFDSGSEQQPGPSNQEKLHFVDGGYFDNSGLVALSTWLDFGLQDLEARNPSMMPTEILVIQILPFPRPEAATEANHNPKTSSFFQILSPLQTVLQVRTEVQAGFSQRDFQFLVKRWELEKEHSVKIRFVTIAYPQIKDATNPPLSWHLRLPDVEEIGQAWNMVKADDDVRCVIDFFRPKSERSPECANH
jgi:hypothetical protein